MSSNFERLQKHIISLSVSKEFMVAKKEWRVIGFEYADNFDNCPCGQDIKELCYLENILNKKKTYVGNVCVKQFIGIDTGNAFDGLKRIIIDEDANPNEDLIINSQKFGYLYEGEYEFLMSIKRKRILTEKQISWKRKINRRIRNKVVVKK